MRGESGVTNKIVKLANFWSWFEILDVASECRHMLTVALHFSVLEGVGQMPCHHLFVMAPYTPF